MVHGLHMEHNKPRLGGEKCSLKCGLHLLRRSSLVWSPVRDSRKTSSPLGKYPAQSSELIPGAQWAQKSRSNLLLNRQRHNSFQQIQNHMTQPAVLPSFQHSGGAGTGHNLLACRVCLRWVCLFFWDLLPPSQKKKKKRVARLLIFPLKTKKGAHSKHDKPRWAQLANSQNALRNNASESKLK